MVYLFLYLREMKRIVVSVTSDLSTDQRVQRVCHSLFQQGYDVFLVGRKLSDSLDFQAPYKFRRMRLIFNRKFLFYAEYNFRLFFLLLFTKVDILISNDLDTLPANYIAFKLKGCKLVFDSHEYFPETPEVFQRKFVKKFWLGIERLFIRNLNGYYTVSQSVANIYKDKYGIDFAVIRSLPFRITNTWQQHREEPFILYQGSVNVGRGLDSAIKAMQYLANYRLVIAGDGPELAGLIKLTDDLKLHNQVNFTGKLLPADLQKLTLAASVGISLEENMGKSYMASLPNKLFDYIQAGVPVLVSDLPEMRAVVEKYAIGLVLKERTAENLAVLVQQMMIDSDHRDIWQQNLKLAATELCWENESVRLIEMVNLL
jgi:glycosyltransferase involved in cell wall biosynthesis